MSLSEVLTVFFCPQHSTFKLEERGQDWMVQSTCGEKRRRGCLLQLYAGFVSLLSYYTACFLRSLELVAHWNL
jgi:hypothetical protein